MEDVTESLLCAVEIFHCHTRCCYEFSGQDADWMVLISAFQELVGLALGEVTLFRSQGLGHCELV